MKDTVSFQSASDGMSDGMAHVCRLYGVNPLAGRLYTLLLLSPHALSLDELCDGAKAAKSTVSTTLRKLEAARVVRRLPPRPDRRDFYEAITDPWAILDDWTRLYFLPEIEMFRRTAAAVERALDDAPDAPAPAVRELLRSRMDGLHELYDVITAAIDSARRTHEPPPPARRIPVVAEEDQ